MILVVKQRAQEAAVAMRADESGKRASWGTGRKIDGEGRCSLADGWFGTNRDHLLKMMRRGGKKEVVRPNTFSGLGKMI